jgi:hypothetical protein
MDKYTYRVTWSDEDGEYIALCAEFPSLSWLSDTQESALAVLKIRLSRLSRICKLQESPFRNLWQPDVTQGSLRFAYRRMCTGNSRFKLRNPGLASTPDQFQAVRITSSYKGNKEY